MRCINPSRAVILNVIGGKNETIARVFLLERIIPADEGEGKLFSVF